MIKNKIILDLTLRTITLSLEMLSFCTLHQNDLILVNKLEKGQYNNNFLAALTILKNDQLFKIKYLHANDPH